MSQPSHGVAELSDSSGRGIHAQRLFFACFASMFATSFGFIVRALLLNDFGTLMNLSETQKGAIQGAGLFPFAISIILFSLFIDRLGYGVVMVFAFAGHIGGTILTIMSIGPKSYEMLYMGTLILALANGAIEAVVNPVTATIFPTKKTHYLNILHAGWPGGLVLGGVLVILMGGTSLQLKLALVLIPTAIYGILLLGQRFPVQERVAAGVSYADMMREFGAAGALLVTWFLVMSLLTVASVFVSQQTLDSGSWASLNNYLPPIVALVVGIGFFAVYKSFGRPMFVFLLLVMILLATTELGVDSWVTDIMTPAFGKHAGWILVYTSFIMFVLRFFAGPIVHRISPLGLLCICAALACVGLLALSSVGNAASLVILAATLYGVGKSFFWPTTLGVVSEQFPRGGALTLNAMGGMGMIAVGVLGGPFLGTILDHNLDQNLEAQQPAIHSVVAGKTTITYMMKYQVLDKSKISALPTDQQNKVNAVTAETKQHSLRLVALFPATMFLCYIGLILFFRGRGGYKVQHIDMSGEKASGGVEGPVR
jgi:MFS family permease